MTDFQGQSIDRESAATVRGESSERRRATSDYFALLRKEDIDPDGRGESQSNESLFPDDCGRRTVTGALPSLSPNDDRVLDEEAARIANLFKHDRQLLDMLAARVRRRWAIDEFGYDPLNSPGLPPSAPFSR